MKIIEHKDHLEIRTDIDWRTLSIAILMAIAILYIPGKVLPIVRYYALTTPALLIWMFITHLFADIKITKGRVSRFIILRWIDVPPNTIFQIRKHEIGTSLNAPLNKAFRFSMYCQTESELHKAIALLEKYYGEKIPTERAIQKQHTTKADQ